MSTVMFPALSTSNLNGNDNNNVHRSKESRIPVPSSPLTLRRSGSLRFPPDSSGRHPPGNDRRKSAGSKTEQADFGLKRGNSFMERGERRGKHGASTSRPQSLDTAGAPKSPRGPHGGDALKSPARMRSLSLSLSSAKLTPNHQPHSPSLTTSSPRTPPTSPLDQQQIYSNNVDWDDTESLTSITSNYSVGSCDHASVARNGTTFSGRSMKYVFHCSQHAGATGEDYLTPTQRVHRQVKKLQRCLHQAKKDLEQKDSEILKLTKEVVELRLCKAALNSPEDRSTSSEAVTVRENSDEQIATSARVEKLSTTDGITDSGHFEDFSSDRTAESPKIQTAEKGVTARLSPERDRLVVEYERRLQELVKTHEDESHKLKQRHNDKVEELLQRIAEINKRYWELVPALDSAKERIGELETQLEDACGKLRPLAGDEKAGERAEAAILETENRVDLTDGRHGAGGGRISVPELLKELQVTKNELENIKDVEYASTSNSLHPLLSAKEALSLWVLGARKAMYRQLIEAKNRNKIDPEITLQFLKSAVYYFLTDKENSQGHLKAIQSILGFSPSEIGNIDKARSS